MIYLFLFFICNILLFFLMFTYLVDEHRHSLLHVSIITSWVMYLFFLLGTVLVASCMYQSWSLSHYCRIHFYSSDVSHKSSNNNVCITVSSPPLSSTVMKPCTLLRAHYIRSSFIILPSIMDHGSLIIDHRPLIDSFFDKSLLITSNTSIITSITSHDDTLTKETRQTMMASGNNR